MLFREKLPRAIAISSLLLMVLSLSSCILLNANETRGTASGSKWLVQIWSSKRCADPGDILTVRATVTNTNSQTMRTVKLENQPVLDMVITNGTKTARWSDGQVPTPDWNYLELRPNESKTIEMTWLAEIGGTVVMEADFIDNPVDSRGPIRAITQVFVGPRCVS